MYTIKKVSEITGIPTVTIRAWENRYHMIAPLRSEGGHRLYTPKDIATLKWLKEQMETKNIKVSEAVRLLKSQSESLIAENNRDSQTQTFEALNDQLYRTLADLNSVQANKMIDMAFAMYGYEEVFHKVLTPVLYRMGSGWESGEITVAQEHFSTEVIMQRFTQFFRVLPTDHQLPKVLAFCPEEENHHIGLMLFSLFLKKKGIDVIYLGANTPYTGLIELIKSKNISIVAISITHPDHAVQLKEWIEKCQRENAHLKFVVGGKGIQASQFSDSPKVTLAEEKDWENWYQEALMTP